MKRNKEHTFDATVTHFSKALTWRRKAGQKVMVKKLDIHMYQHKSKLILIILY